MKYWPYVVREDEARACLRGFPIVYRPPVRGKIGGSRGGTDKQDEDEDEEKIDKGSSKRETDPRYVGAEY